MLSEIYASVLFNICKAYSPEADWPIVTKDPLSHGFTSESGDNLCNLLLIMILEGSDELHSQESTVS